MQLKMFGIRKQPQGWKYIAYSIPIVQFEKSHLSIASFKLELDKAKD